MMLSKTEAPDNKCAQITKSVEQRYCQQQLLGEISIACSPTVHTWLLINVQTL